MLINTNSLLSITDENQNFSQATKMVDQNKTVTIIKNNKLAYILIKFREDNLELASTEQVLLLGNQVIDENNMEAFMEMAKLYSI